nr:FAD-binding oxidoreductase [Burkholderiaceae bacterium]
MSAADELLTRATTPFATSGIAGRPSAPLLAALRQAVGDEHVSTSEEQLAAYSRCTIPWDARCAAVVFPGSTQEVAQLLRAANQHRVPVWPYSGGRNWGYGATLATQPGAVVMILRRMNRIVEVNEELAYAVIEPGVSYRQLSEHLRSRGHALWADCIDGTPDGSVIGNALDRGIGETPYGDHFGNLCGLEVVLPTGETVTTGGGTADLRTRHVHKWGVGPYVEGLFSQSNLGVVTRAGIWLMPQPESFNSFVFELHDEAHFPAVVDAFRRLALDGVLTSKLHMINDFVSTTILTQRNLEQLPQDRPMSADDRARIRAKYRLAPWSCAGGLYGPKAHVALQRRALKRQLGRFGRLLFVSDRKVALLERLVAAAWQRPRLRWAAEIALGASLPVMDSLPQVHRILKGIPTDYFLKHAYYRNRRPRPTEGVDPARDRCGLIWFAPVLPN